MNRRPYVLGILTFQLSFSEPHVSTEEEMGGL